MNPTVFLDRDGTLIVEQPGFVTSPSQLDLIPGAAAALARLHRAGFRIALVTNQSGIGRGILSEDDFATIQAELERRLAQAGVKLDLVLYCPHHPTEARGEYRVECTCRKPKPGMMLTAARTLDSDLPRSYSIGDDLRDLETTIGSPVTPILVLTGKGRRVESKARELFGERLHVAEDLSAAADWIVAQG